MMEKNVCLLRLCLLFSRHKRGSLLSAGKELNQQNIFVSLCKMPWRVYRAIGKN